MSVVGRWKAIGRGFRIDSERLDQIQTDNHGDCEECLEDVVKCWLRRNYDVELFGVPTWRAVVKVVARPVAGNNYLLALSIAGRHSGNRFSAVEDSLSTLTLTDKESLCCIEICGCG